MRLRPIIQRFHFLFARRGEMEHELAAVIRAVESGAECRDIVIQLSAVSKALDRAGYAIVASAISG